jgi:hypothetical protein
MKNLLFLFIVLPLFCLAQDHRGHQTALLAKDDATPDVMLGTPIAIGATTNTSREQVLRDPLLIAVNPDCAVTGFTFSMSSGNKSWGPVTVKGMRLTDDIKDKIGDWDTNNVTITFDNIHLKCNSAETTARPLVLKYDH